MSFHDAVKVLEKVAKANKVKTEQIRARNGSNKPGAVRAKGPSNDVKIAVRANDIVVYCPKDFLKCKEGTVLKNWEHVTVFKHDEDPKVLEKVFKKAIKDKKKNAEWMREKNALGRSAYKRAEKATTKAKKAKKQIKARKANATKAKKKVATKVKPKIVKKTVLRKAIKKVAVEG